MKYKVHTLTFISLIVSVGYAMGVSPPKPQTKHQSNQSSISLKTEFASVAAAKEFFDKQKIPIKVYETGKWVIIIELPFSGNNACNVWIFRTYKSILYFNSYSTLYDLVNFDFLVKREENYICIYNNNQLYLKINYN